MDFDNKEVTRQFFEELALLHMIFKECPCAWIHLLKAHWLHVYTTLVLIISDPSIKCASSSISSDGITAMTITDKSAWDVESDSYRLQNGVLGPVMENPPHWDIVNCSYARTFVISSLLNISETTLSTFVISSLLNISETTLSTFVISSLLNISETTLSYSFRNTVLRPVKEHPVHGCTVYSSSDYAVAISRLWQTISLILPTSTLRKSVLATWGYCEPFLCPSSCYFASLCEVEFMNTVSGPVEEHQGEPLHSFSDYAIVMSRLWQTISEILPTNTLRKPALATWGYCKPFLYPWSGDFVSLYEVEFKYMMLRQVKEHHGGTVHNYSNYAVVILRFWQIISEFIPTSTLRKPALATWGYCKPFLYPWSCNFVSLYEAEFKNTVLEPVKEHNVGTVHNVSDYAVVISRFWQTIRELLPTSTLRKPALATWGYCKPFLCPWSCDFVSLCEVEFKNTVLKSVKKHHGGMIQSSSDYAVVISRLWQTISDIRPTSTLRNPAFEIWGYCKPFLCPWSYDFLRLCEVECRNTVLGLGKKQHGDTINSSSDYAVVISRLWQIISEILPSSTFRKPRIGDMGVL